MVIFLEDEWLDEIPYMDGEFAKKSRSFALYMGLLLNLDLPYWLYVIYSKEKRDGVVEHMTCLGRLG